jgi:hypothetical protein
MPLDFFMDCCRTTSSALCFGLCDDPLLPEEPAYIDEKDRTKWIGVVDNPNSQLVDFFAVDHCVKYPQKKCEGILRYDANLIFVELKDRKSDGWEERGMEQIETSINVFKMNHDISIYTVSANVCNKKPYFSNSNINLIQKFKTDTGYNISFKQKIII